MPSELEQEHLLYDSVQGERIGLRKLQNAAPLAERKPRLHLLLEHPDLFVVYQAAQLLTAWGDGAGLDKLEQLVDRQIHLELEFAPHRLYGYDNVYDILADAVSIYGLNSDDRREQRQRVFAKLLQLYGPCDFERWLRDALLDSDFLELAPAIDQAITRALRFKKPYLASQLLPSLARFDPSRAIARFDEFSGLGPMTPNPEVNVAEALRYVPPDVGRPRLEKLIHHKDHVVANQAKDSLAAISAQ